MSGKLTQERIKEGFTIVELSLSIAFIAILSILVVLIISNAISSYHRGITLNQINTVGMDVVDDLRNAVQDSSARSVVKFCSEVYSNAEKRQECEDDHGMTLVVAERVGAVTMGGNSVTDIPLYGAFCTGGYSYIWNSGYFFTDNNASEVYKGDGVGEGADLKYRLAGSETVHNWREEHDNTNFKLLKVKDENRLVCRAAALNGSEDDYYLKSTDAGRSLKSAAFDISKGFVEEEPVDILEGSSNLAIYELTSALPAESVGTNNTLYSVSFILGTIQGGINVKAQGSYCATPDGEENANAENFDYCAINKFNFAAQATGG